MKVNKMTAKPVQSQDQTQVNPQRSSMVEASEQRQIYRIAFLSNLVAVAVVAVIICLLTPAPTRWYVLAFSLVFILVNSVLMSFVLMRIRKKYPLPQASEDMATAEAQDAQAADMLEKK